MKKLVKGKSQSVLLFIAIILATTIYSVHILKYKNIELAEKERQIQFVIKENNLISEYNQTIICDNERLYTILDSLPLGSPINDSIEISSDYGGRKNPFNNGWNFHSGLDIHAWIYDTIYSTGSGTVKKAYWMGGYGRCIVISHISGYESTYAHLYRMFVKKGDSIKKGQAIGRAGNSGAVTGPHLHYEVRRNGKSTDPLWYINLNKK